MGERGPKSNVVTKLSPEDRRELDMAIIEGSETKSALYEHYKHRVECSYRSFCTYAHRLEMSAKHRIIGGMVRMLENRQSARRRAERQTAFNG